MLAFEGMLIYLDLHLLFLAKQGTVVYGLSGIPGAQRRRRMLAAGM